MGVPSVEGGSLHERRVPRPEDGPWHPHYHGRGFRVLSILQRSGPLLALLLLVAGVSLASEDLRKPENFFNIVNQWSFVGLVAIGMTAVILLGGIDLSVGSM